MPLEIEIRNSEKDSKEVRWQEWLELIFLGLKAKQSVQRPFLSYLNILEWLPTL